MAAAIAFYTLLSLAPLLVIAVGVGGFVFGSEAAQREVISQIHHLAGADAAAAAGDLLENASRPAAVVGGTFVGVIALFIGATAVFGELQSALNTIWDVKPRKDAPWYDYLKTRAVSFAIVLTTGFLLLVSLVLSAAISGFTAWSGSRLPALAPFAHWMDTGLSLLVVTLLFALVYRVIPDATISWRDVWLGALVTSVLFAIGKSVLGLYLGNSGLASAYGAAGSLVALLVWVYYSAQVALFGAELTHAWTVRRRTVQPIPMARRAREPRTA
jgi:membrane protein